MAQQNTIKALKKTIYTRRSVRKYTPEPLNSETLEKIKAFCGELKPLYEDIKVHFEIVGKEDVKCIMPWIAPQVLAIFSQKTDGYLENIGFMFQQAELYMQSLGLGVCWLGMGRLDSSAKSRFAKENDLPFVMMLAFGTTDELARTDTAQFKRRPLSDISDEEDIRLEPARLAPSSVNSQPWFFTHQEQDAGILHAYVATRGLFGITSLADMNRIDMGIAMAHMYASYPENFEFFKVSAPKKVKAHEYIGSFRI